MIFVASLYPQGLYRGAVKILKPAYLLSFPVQGRVCLSFGRVGLSMFLGMGIWIPRNSHPHRSDPQTDRNLPAESCMKDENVILLFFLQDGLSQLSGSSRWINEDQPLVVSNCQWAATAINQ